MGRYFFYNTDLVYSNGKRRTNILIKNRFAATGGVPNYGEQLGKLSRGDTLLMYENGVGVIGIGSVLERWNGMTYKTARYYPKNSHSGKEYRIAVRWDAKLCKLLHDSPITIGELRVRFGSPGYTPRGAVLRISKHHQTAAELVLGLQSRTTPKVGCPETEDVIEVFTQHGDTSTTARREIDARLGQGQFREDVFSKWGRFCAVTRTTTTAAIRASHIKPWSDFPKIRLDPYNGIPLVATLDALFDKGLISFDATGRMLVKESLAEDERRILGVSEERQICLPSDATAKYLEWHRKHFKFES